MEDATYSHVERPLLSLLFSIVFASPALACMNDYSPNVAAMERSKSVLEQLQKHVEKEPWDVRRDRLRKELASGGDYKVKNDLATTLAHTGETAEALTLLEQIEAEKPGLYITASNLGTAYELSGNDEKALEWIKKGIERNPDSHGGTEWLHVRILEAKLALKSDPGWLDSHSIVDPERFVGAPGISANGNRGEKLSTEQIKKALTYQLHERLQFVLPPDAIVGALLFELGDLIRDEPVGPEAAAEVLKLAGTYLKDLPNAGTLQQVTDVETYIVGRHAHRASRKSPTAFLGDPSMIALVGVLISLPVIALKRFIQRRRAG